MARATRLLSTHFERDAALKKLRYVGIAAVPVVIIAVTLAILGAVGVLIPKKAANKSAPACGVNVCLNEGVCVDFNQTLSCMCPTGYTGSGCETMIDNCASEPCDYGGICTAAVNAYTCTCTPQYTGVHCDIGIYRYAFYVNTMSSSSVSQVPFMSAHTLVGTPGFIAPDTYVSPHAGYYWFFFTVTWDGTTYAQYYMNGTNQPTPQAVRMHTAFTGRDTMSRDIIIDMTSTQMLSMATNYPIYGDSTLNSGWGGLRLQQLMDPLVLVEASFAVNRTSSSVLVPSSVVFNEGNAWSSSQSAFVAPRAGIYYFGTSYGVASLTNASVALYRNNGGSYHCLMAYSLSNHEGVDTISRGCIMQLRAGDVIQMRTLTSSAQFDSSYAETTLRAFLYSPVYTQIAWSVCASNDLPSSGNGQVFQSVNVNQGGAWNTATNQLIAPERGSYYMEIVTSGPGDFSVVIASSSIVIGRLVFDRQSPSFYVTRSRPMMADLAAGQAVQITFSNAQATASYSAFSGTANVVRVFEAVCFHGFKI